MSLFAVTTMIRDLKHYYAGYQAESFVDSGPIFNKTCTAKARFDEATADAAVRQLTHMGYSVTKEQLKERKKRGPRLKAFLR